MAPLEVLQILLSLGFGFFACSVHHEDDSVPKPHVLV